MKRLFIASFAILLTAICTFGRQPERGYRGFVDWTNRIYRWENSFKHNTCFATGISTSHGYQFNHWLFAGVGIDYTLDDGCYYTWDQNGKPHNHLHFDTDNYFLSLFADVRTDLQLGKFTPFADVRLGVNATSNGTVYFSPSIGYRFNWGRKVGINVGVGYTLDAFRYDKLKEVTTTDGYLWWVPSGERYNFTQSSFTFRLGIDF